MVAIFDESNLPDHLFSIPELDFREDLFADRRGGLWFRLGTWTIRSRRNHRGVEDMIERQSFMIPPGDFSEIFEKLDSVGEVMRSLGTPGGSVRSEGELKAYRYLPFHQFDVSFTAISGEPLVFCRRFGSSRNLFVNPDLYLYLELEEKTSGVRRLVGSKTRSRGASASPSREG